MKIGLLCEGPYDEEPLKELITKIIDSPPNTNILRFSVFRSGGSLTDTIIGSALASFDVFACDVIVVVVDTDNDNAKPNQVKGTVKTNASNLAFTKPIRYGFPDPELEQWLITEADSLKSICGLDPSQGPPYESQSMYPKERFRRIVDEAIQMGRIDIGETMRGVYQKVAHGINVEALRKRNISFEAFFMELVGHRMP